MDWKACEGHIVDGVFTLGEFLGGQENSASFATTDGMRAAVIRVHLSSSRDPQAQIVLWERISKLSHPNLMRLFRWGKGEVLGEPVHYVVTEQADEVLGQVIRERPLDLDEVRVLIGPVLDALAYLHDHGYVHGRVRPAYMFAVSESVKLASDAIVPLLEAGRMVRDSSAYDAPEVAQGMLTTASDVWSLGWSLIEVMTQHAPGKGSLPEALPEPFEEIVLHSLKAEPGERWTVHQIARRLRGESVGGPEPVLAKVRRFGIPAAVAVVALAAWLRSGGETTPPPAPTPEPVVEPTPPPPAGKKAAKQPKAETPKPEPPKPEPPKENRPSPMPAAQEPPPEPPSTPAAALPAEVVQSVLPKVDPQAQRTVSGRIRVAVVADVDDTGSVRGTRIESGRSRYFNGISTEAVRQWKFSPGTPRPRVIVFEFTRTGPAILSVR